MSRSKPEFKIRALKYFILFLTAMLIMTFVSRGIYAYKLPRVNSTNMRNTLLSYKIESCGIAETSRELPIVVLPDLRIAEVCVKNGDVVDVGDVILKYDEEYLKEYIHKLSIEIETDKLTKSDYNSASAWNSAKIIAFSIEEKQKKLAEYEQLLEKNSEIHSKMKGMITQVKVSAGDFTNNAACFMIAEVSKNLYFSADITGAQSQLIAVGDKVNLSFKNDKIRLDNCVITSITESDSGDAYTVIIPLKDAVVSIGEVGTLSVTVMSEQKYDCFPLEAVHTNNGQSFVYIITENESFLGNGYKVVKKSIDIAEENDIYAAAIDSGISKDDKIVSYATKELYDEQNVRYIEK